MAKITHVALSTQDVDKTAAFYINVFEMKEIARIDSQQRRGQVQRPRPRHGRRVGNRLGGDLRLPRLGIPEDTGRRARWPGSRAGRAGLAGPEHLEGDVVPEHPITLPLRLVEELVGRRLLRKG